MNARGDAGVRPFDVVFVPSLPTGRRTTAAVLCAVALHALAFAWVQITEPSLEQWAATLSVEVHHELTRMEVAIEPERQPPLPEPEPAQPEAPTPIAEPPPTPAPLASPPRASAQPVPDTSAATAAADASEVLDAPADAVADLTREVYVVGEASSYIGGSTRPGGTSAVPTRGKQSVAQSSAKPSTGAASPPSRARPVTIVDHDWQCPWPRAADRLDFDEQIAIVRVEVRADGVLDQVTLVHDPGHGFGAAAVACVKTAQFSPALDDRGQPRRASSPPIRVHFTR